MGIKSPIHAEVTSREGPPEVMIRKFKKKVKKSGILELVKERRYYTKKSVKRRMKRKEKLRKAKEATRKMKEKQARYS
jgi:ribosomal protein S21